MKLFIDCEWNGFRGKLVSMALCAHNEQKDEFYEVLYCNSPELWVRENVVPVLKKRPVIYAEFVEKLAAFLNKFDRVHIIADWPEDIAYFCNVLITSPGKRISTPHMTMEIYRINGESRIPHNALWDARALKEAYLNEISD